MRTALVVSRYFPNDSRTVGVHQRLGTQVQALAKVVDRVDCLFLQPVERHYAAAELQEHERSEEHTSELQSPCNLVCRLLLEKKKKTTMHDSPNRDGNNPYIGVHIYRPYTMVN